MSATAIPVALPGDLLVERDLRDELFGHPKGVYVCFFTEMWERFSFYGMKALLLLYLLQHHKFGDKAGLDVLGAYGGLVYCVPVRKPALPMRTMRSEPPGSTRYAPSPLKLGLFSHVCCTNSNCRDRLAARQMK